MKKPNIGKPMAIALPFFFVHSAIFYAIIYFLARANPLAALGAGFFVTIVYSIFYYILFEKGYQSAFVSAAISIITGLIFGDWLIDKFYPDSLLTNNLHLAVMILLVHNVYLFLDLVRYILKPSNPQTVSHESVRQRRALLAVGVCFGILILGTLINIIDFEKKLEQRIAGASTYRDRELGFIVTFPIIEMRKTWAEKSPDEITTGIMIRFYWDAAGTRWTGAGFDPYIIRAIPINWWREKKLQGEILDSPDNYLGTYLGQNDQYIFLGVTGVECPSKLNQLTGEILDSKLCKLAQQPPEEVFKTFKITDK